jgi:hypothetical protein
MSALTDIKLYLSLVPANVTKRSKLKWVRLILNQSLDSIILEKNFDEKYLYECLNILRSFLLDFADSDLNRLKGWFRPRDCNLKKLLSDKFSEDIAEFINTILNLDSDDYNEIKKVKQSVIYEEDDLDLDYEKYLATTEILLQSSDWRDNYAGLIACLGRRPTEYLSENAFSLIESEEGFELFFNNQLKKKGSETESYLLYSMYNPQEIFEIWQRFINHEEVQQKINECKYSLSNSNLSEESYQVKLNECLKEKFNFVVNKVIKNHFEWLDFSPRLKEMSARVLRHACAMLVTSLTQDITSSKRCEIFFREFLGHSQDESNVTIGYKDYKKIPGIRGLIPTFTKLEIIKQLEEIVSVSTIERLKRASKDKNIDIDTLLNMCLEKLESEDTLLDISTNLDEVKGIQTPYSARQKIYLAYKKIVAHNDNPTTIPNNRYAITVRALQDLSGSRHTAIKSFIDEYQDDINVHHNKYDLGTYSNKGKQDITKIIQ